MTRTTILGCTPSCVASLGHTYEERECLALLTQLVSQVGAAPSTVVFHLHRVYDVEVDLSFLALSSVPPPKVPVIPTRTVLAISHRANDNEAIDYVLAVEAAYDSTKAWTTLAKRQLGSSYNRH